MKDFLKRDLAVDDSVIFITPGYRDFSLGRVTSFTPKRVRVSYLQDNKWPKEIIQAPSQLIRVAGPELTMYLLQKNG